MFVFVILAILFLVIGLWEASRAILDTFHLSSSKQWVEVEGRLVERQAREVSWLTRLVWMRGGFVPEVVYEYQVDSATFKAGRIVFGGFYPARREAADGVIDRYLDGDTLKVYYDPQNPRRAVLDRDTNKYVIRSYQRCLVFLIAGLIILRNV